MAKARETQLDPAIRRDTITLPAGTRVKQISFKDDQAFVQIWGHMSHSRLEAVGDTE